MCLLLLLFCYKLGEFIHLSVFFSLSILYIHEYFNFSPRVTLFPRSVCVLFAIFDFRVSLIFIETLFTLFFLRYCFCFVTRVTNYVCSTFPLTNNNKLITAVFALACALA